jgi:5-methylcytosine-specific restriction endonuclease McrA
VGQKGKDCGGIGTLNYTKLIAVSTALLVLGIAIVSFTLSYNVLQKVAEENGVSPGLSYLWPLLVDASLVIFSLAVVHTYLQSESPVKQWALVGVYTLGTIAFNIAHADASTMARIVAAIPPISLFFSFEMLMRQLRLSIQKHEISCKIEEMEIISQELKTEQKEKEKYIEEITDTIEKADKLNTFWLKLASYSNIKKKLTGSQWNELRGLVWERDGKKCTVCGISLLDKNYHCHHVLPASAGGKDKPANLTTLCAKCHKDLHGIESLVPVQPNFLAKATIARTEKIANRRKEVAKLHAEGVSLKEIAMQVGIKDARTIKSDIASFNGQNVKQ